MFTNPLELFNLRETPYFQEPLKGEKGRYPLSLFVGREKAVTNHLRHIAMKPGGSRQTIKGQPGVGKSTLAQYVKAWAAKESNLLTVEDAVSLGGAADVDDVCTQILRTTFDAILLGAKSRGKSDLGSASVMQEAIQLVRVARVSTGHGGGLNFAGFGVSASSSDTLVTPSAAKPSLLVQSLLPRLMDIARTEVGANGILLHLNNLENLTANDAKRAASILRDLRDPVLLSTHYHWLVVGTEDAVNTVVDSVEQLQTHFNRPHALGPLTESEVTALLEKRYQELRADDTKPYRPPIEPDAVRTIYELHGGSLRSTFAALDAAATELLGTGANGPTAPLTTTDVMPFLIQWTLTTATGHLSPSGTHQLLALAHAFSDAPFTRLDVQRRILETSNDNTGREYMEKLVRYGYVNELAERRSIGRGRPAIQYTIAGPTRLLLQF